MVNPSLTPVIPVALASANQGRWPASQSHVPLSSVAIQPCVTAVPSATTVATRGRRWRAARYSMTRVTSVTSVSASPAPWSVRGRCAARSRVNTPCSEAAVRTAAPACTTAVSTARARPSPTQTTLVASAPATGGRWCAGDRSALRWPAPTPRRGRAARSAVTASTWVGGYEKVSDSRTPQTDARCASAGAVTCHAFRRSVPEHSAVIQFSATAARSARTASTREWSVAVASSSQTPATVAARAGAWAATWFASRRRAPSPPAPTPSRAGAAWNAHAATSTTSATMTGSASLTLRTIARPVSAGAAMFAASWKTAPRVHLAPTRSPSPADAAQCAMRAVSIR